MSLWKKLNLQFFADGEEVDTPPSNEDTSGEDDLYSIIQQLRNDNPEETEEELDEIEEETEDEPEEEEQPEDEVEEESDEPEETDDEKGKKREQSREENAKFAAQRRQKELDERVQREIEKLRAESPEFQLAQRMQKTYGKTPEEIMEEMVEAELAREAEQRQLPIELLRERQTDRDRVSKLEDELNQLRYQSWQNQVETDSAKIRDQYKFLEQADMDKAVDYILNVAKNVEIPLEQAVFAVHGQKIVQELANQKIQDELAQQSGRKSKTPPPPNKGKTVPVVSLTAEEREIAKAFGMTAAEYQKYKS